MKRAQAEAGQDAQNNLTQGAQYAERGLQALQTAPKPDGTSDADFNKMKTQMSAIFNGTSGMAALQAKNYPQAQQRLRAAVQADPNDLRNVYPLALADLTGTPPNSVEGLYFIARAADLAAGQPSQAQIESYGKSQYTKYHGSDQGWTDLEAQAKTNPMPPAGFTITQYVPPTPAQQAADLVKTKAPKDMSFAEWELVLSAGQPADADKVWSAIKGVPLQMEGTVIKASPTELQIAASQDDIDQKRADVIVTDGRNDSCPAHAAGGRHARLRRNAGFLHAKPVRYDYGEGRVADEGRAEETAGSPSPRSAVNHHCGRTGIARAARWRCPHFLPLQRSERDLSGIFSYRKQRDERCGGDVS